MSRTVLVWTVMAGSIVCSTAGSLAHDPHENNTGTANTYITLTASTGIGFPLSGETVNGGQVLEQSNSWHFVSLKNNNPWYSIPGTYDWKMGLYHDSDTTPHSTNDQTGTGVTLAALEERVYPADLAKLSNIPIGAHSVHAEAAIRKNGAGNPWVVAPAHSHAYQRDN